KSASSSRSVRLRKPARPDARARLGKKAAILAAFLFKRLCVRSAATGNPLAALLRLGHEARLGCSLALGQITEGGVEDPFQRQQSLIFRLCVRLLPGALCDRLSFLERFARSVADFLLSRPARRSHDLVFSFCRATAAASVRQRHIVKEYFPASDIGCTGIGTSPQQRYVPLCSSARHELMPGICAAARYL